MDTPVPAYLGLGSNVGDRLSNLKQAVLLLGGTEGMEVRRAAPVYESEPWGVKEQRWFLNTVVEIGTTLGPGGLLDAAKRVEADLGRKARRRWGPREIDVDILLYDDLEVATDELTIPHGRLEERLFVLLPLRDLLPEWRNREGVAIAALIERLRGTGVARPYPASL